ncbi:hypothetical protein ACLOJK_031636 [Asimina triloba]
MRRWEFKEGKGVKGLEEELTGADGMTINSDGMVAVMAHRTGNSSTEMGTCRWQLKFDREQGARFGASRQGGRRNSRRRQINADRQRAGARFDAGRSKNSEEEKADRCWSTWRKKERSNPHRRAQRWEDDDEEKEDGWADGRWKIRKGKIAIDRREMVAPMAKR